jgi:hypothetical protein
MSHCSSGVRLDVAEATQPVISCYPLAWVVVMYIPHGITRRRGRSPLLAVSTLCAALPVVAVIVQAETVNGQGGNSKDPRRNRQLFPPKHSLQTAVRIVFLEKNAVLLYLTNRVVVTI